MVTKKWTYEACYEEAKKYKTQAELRHNSKGAYMAAYRNGWLKDYTWFVLIQKPTGYWNKERCEKEAKKYETKNEFQKLGGSAYNAALKNGWLKDYTWFENGYSLANTKRAIWTYEKCKEIALTCRTVTEFFKKSISAYNACYKHNWLNEFDWLVRTENIYKAKRDNVYAYIFSELKSVYIGRTVNVEIRNSRHNTDKKSTVYKFAQTNDVPIPLMTILESDLTLEEGLEKEDYYVNKYREEGWAVLNKAKTGVRSGAIGCLNSHKWNKKTCYEEAKKYKSRTQFCRENGSAYYVARKNGWLNDYTWFIKVKNHRKIVVKYSLKGEKIEQYNSISDAAKINGFSDGNIISCCKGKIKSAYGFVWKYKESEVA